LLDIELSWAGVMPLNLDVLFASSKGSQYRYYKALANATNYKAKVVTLIPTLKLNVFNSGLNTKLIRDCLSFHMERKRRKYVGSTEYGFLLKVYYIFSGLYFSLIYLSYLSCFKKMSPKVVCLWNGHRLPEMAIKAAASRCNVKVAHFENGLLPDSTIMDFEGVNAFSSLPKDPEFYLEYAKSKQVSKVEKSLEVRLPHKKRKGLIFEEFDFDQKYIFVPFQVNFDSQVIINSPRVNSMVELYEILEKTLIMINSKNIIFVIKEHPSDSYTYSDLHGRNDRIKFVNENTEDLIRNAKAVITLNSSVGIEASMLGKTVLVLGNACYGIEGVTTPVNSLKELVDVIDNIDNYAQVLNISDSFFYYLENEYLLPGAWQNQLKNVEPHHLIAFENKIGAAYCVGNKSG